MPQNNSNPEKDMTADSAMNVVLQAEHTARQRVDQCRNEADVLLQQAQQTAHKIAQRVDDRITRIHQRCHRVIADQVKQIKSAQQQNIQDSDKNQPDLAAVDAVVDEIVRRLTNPDA